MYLYVRKGHKTYKVQQTEGGICMQGGDYLIFGYGCVCRGRGSRENVRTQMKT